MSPEPTPPNPTSCGAALRPRRILALNASHRGPRGYTHFLLDLLLQGAREQGAHTELVDLARLEITPCRACEACHTPKRRLRCLMEERDDVAGLFQRMRRADLIVYGTPVYVFGVASRLKTLWERMYGVCDVRRLCLTRSGLIFHHVDSLCTKPLAAVICCDSLEAAIPANAVHHFRTYARFMDAPLAGILVRNGAALAGHGDPQAVRRFPALESVYRAYRRAGAELALRGRISRRTRARANREIVPLPAFALLKRLRPFKPRILERARAFLSQEEQP